MQTRFIRLFSFSLAMLLCVGCGGDTPPPSPPPATESDLQVQASPEAEQVMPEMASAVTPPVPQGPPRVELTTNLGKIVLELDDQAAPGTVANFLEYVDAGHYDDTIIHQVIENYIALGGGYDRELTLRPARSPIRNEAHNGLKNLRGTIAMARDFELIDSSTSQFFLNLHDNPELDHQGRETAEDYGYCVFGKMVQGEELLDQISQTSTRDTDEFQLLPTQQIVIKSARRLLDGNASRSARNSDSRTTR